MTIASVQELLKDTTNVVRLRRVQDDVTRAWLIDATVKCTLFDPDGNAVVGATDLPMDYAAGSSAAKGEYRATLSHTLPLVLGALYGLVITAQAADGSQRVFHEPCKCVEG